MKDTQTINISVFLQEVCDPVMPIKQDTDVPRGGHVMVANLGKAGEDLRAIIDTLNGKRGGGRIIGGDELEDVLEPALSLFGPRYRCHARMRCAISSFEIVRFASESASPRSTIT